MSHVCNMHTTYKTHDNNALINADLPTKDPCLPHLPWKTFFSTKNQILEPTFGQFSNTTHVK